MYVLIDGEMVPVESQEIYEMAKTERVFTPIDSETQERVCFKRSDVKVLKGDLDRNGLGVHAIIEVNGTEYVVLGKECNLDCACDAEIIPFDGEIKELLEGVELPI